MKFAERLKDERKRKRYNQTYIAKYMKVSQVSVSNLERGVNEPNFQALIDLANLFGVSTDYLLGIKDTKD